MKKKQAVLKFLTDNYVMINSLMCGEEVKELGDVSKILIDGINLEIEKEAKH
jgi:hypothetical protein